MTKTVLPPRTLRQLPLERRFGYRFNMIARALAQHTLLHVERDFGLNLAEFRILSVLAHRTSPSIRDIAAHAQLDKAQVTRALADLVGRGLVSQVVDAQDRRLRVVKLTRAGQAIFAATLPISIERQARLEQRLTGSELRILWKALAVLTEEAERMLAEEEQTGALHRRAAATLNRAAARRSAPR